MKHILDSSFHYRPSFDTDVRKTFEKVRQQQGERRDPAGGEADAKPVGPRIKILQLEQLKKASSA
jgi:aromatic ring-cleaving dioxygenase